MDYQVQLAAARLPAPLCRTIPDPGGASVHCRGSRYRAAPSCSRRAGCCRGALARSSPRCGDDAIDAGKRNPANRSTAQAGKILGIIGTVFLIIGVAVLLILLIVGLIAAAS